MNKIFEAALSINGRLTGCLFLFDHFTSVLAVAIANGYGLVCDERVVRDEYKRVTGLIGLHSWGLIDMAVQKGFLDKEYAEPVVNK